MKWKYNLVFLFILSALALPEKLNAQHCLDFKYDKSGNRIEMFVHDCGFEYKEQTREMIDEEISEENINEDLLVYPNPNKGSFMVDIKDNNEETASYLVFDATGTLVQKGECSINQMVDITNNPAGVYLLRIIKGEYVYSRVVVKL
jgi:hypothetical protein